MTEDLRSLQITDAIHRAQTGQPPVDYSANPRPWEARPWKVVTVPETPEHGGISAVRIRLHWECPICGGPRGEVFPTVSFDGSLRLHVDGWNNACGHVDKYEDVVAEARREADLAAAGDRAHGFSCMGGCGAWTATKLMCKNCEIDAGHVARS